MLSKRSCWNNRLCWWVCPLQLNVHRRGSSRGFGRALLPLHEHESEPTPVLHLPLKTWAEPSLINLARSSPSLHIFLSCVFRARAQARQSGMHRPLWAGSFHLSVQTLQSNLKINKASSPDSGKDNLPALSHLPAHRGGCSWADREVRGGGGELVAVCRHPLTISSRPSGSHCRDQLSP